MSTKPALPVLMRPFGSAIIHYQPPEKDSAIIRRDQVRKSSNLIVPHPEVNLMSKMYLCDSGGSSYYPCDVSSPVLMHVCRAIPRRHDRRDPDLGRFSSLSAMSSTLNFSRSISVRLRRKRFVPSPGYCKDTSRSTQRYSQAVSLLILKRGGSAYKLRLNFGLEELRAISCEYDTNQIVHGFVLASRISL